ncbi:MAG: zf-HC2 domain-containing protein [Elusimicrobia bacterium]|nr:zf-HC2 domain-containing protein [Elusimicrobiota bacterium]
MGCGKYDNNLINLYIDGELDGPGAEEFCKHLESCGVCRGELKELESALSGIKKAVLPPAPENIRRRVMEKLARVRKTARTLYLLVPAAAAAAVLLASYISLNRTKPGHVTDYVNTQINYLYGESLVDVYADDDKDNTVIGLILGGEDI